MINQEMSTRFRWCLVDLVGKTKREIEEFPCWLDVEGGCGLRVGACGEMLLEYGGQGGSIVPPLLNGIPFRSPCLLNEGEDYSLMIGGRLYLLRGGVDFGNWLHSLDFENWVLQDVHSGQQFGEVAFGAIDEFAARHQLDPQRTITSVKGAQQAFYLKDVLPLFRAPAQDPPPLPVTPSPASQRSAGGNAEAPGPVKPEIDIFDGEFTCPHCWLCFDRGDVLWIARTPSLRDPDLGADFPMRFFPTQFERGRAVDAGGEVCTDTACPNCRSKLPPQFLDLDTHIFSVVGAPSAGKSYFLTSMIHRLEEVMPTYFGLSFQDGDSSGNSILSLMQARLFSGADLPDEISLEKTVPGGEMFKSWSRNGREIKLPKPFTYLVSPFDTSHEGEQSIQLVFYDNAGEQFEPAEISEALESQDSDTTRHLTRSSAVFFLYDPASNVKIRSLLVGKDDPQLTMDQFRKLNRQDNILAEIRNRIKTELNVSANERIRTPLAMVIGKCDLWMDLLDERLEYPIAEKGLSLETVEKNSRIIRDFLMKTSPAVVANAESISSEVVYFPVSPIGHSPQPYQTGDGLKIGPVPGKVNPLYPEVPVVWALARSYPNLIRSF